MRTEIKSVADYLGWVKQMHNITNDESGLQFEQSRIYYRGQASESWKLTPSLFREHTKGLDEYRLLEMAQKRLWHELRVFDSYLNRLVFLQHYGLPTRLLDVTSNPLVALYFACSDYKQNNGVVYCTYEKYDNLSLIENLAKYVFTTNFSRIGILEGVPQIDLYESRGDAFFEEQYMMPFFCIPPSSNQRIIQQNGAFIMAPLLSARPKDLGKLPMFNGELKNIFDERVAVIPHEYKESVKNELYEYGIDKGTLFVDVPSIIESIVENGRNRALRLDV